ncbi:acyl-phosphate glycerol 3-phosphate acyltransferase [Deinococcus metalli]|uniref:Acyl-phosphate glycerol 3-phosphate acyltransferase n=1 Tax=Deinococcus metalli TaxID=1141878 RepID=A0A7W8KDK5_9DEIO|nr:glycerol-3-phosphate acyltransferase [Deinococcus metalli]MBB5374564.1 acyl-phosphate glycerol 3-phosphate acyltransferase [Deinococcus metalli]GHF35338.1 glycerol-3-phosphate acyltransferase 2 [Deinococcus metalli]
MPALLLVAAASYLLGSLVAGVLYSRLRGEDIRGRDLPGGSGTYRQYGVGAAVLVTALDILKGAAAAALALHVTPQATWIAMLGVVLGHCYPVYFRFQGGGGIAPLLGALLVVAPLTLAGTVATALVVIPLYKATLQSRVTLNAVPVATVIAVPVGLLLATRYGGLADLLAGGAAMAVRAAHLLIRPPVPAPGAGRS